MTRFQRSFASAVFVVAFLSSGPTVEAVEYPPIPSPTSVLWGRWAPNGPCLPYGTSPCLEEEGCARDDGEVGLDLAPDEEYTLDITLETCDTDCCSDCGFGAECDTHVGAAYNVYLLDQNDSVIEQRNVPVYSSPETVQLVAKGTLGSCGHPTKLLVGITPTGSQQGGFGVIGSKVRRLGYNRAGASLETAPSIGNRSDWFGNMTHTDDFACDADHFWRLELFPGDTLKVSAEVTGESGIGHNSTLRLLDSEGSLELDLFSSGATATPDTIFDHYVHTGSAGIYYLKMDRVTWSVTDYKMAFEIVRNCASMTEDTDGDGLTDRWEACGIDADGDDVVDYTLPDAALYRKDVYLEIDAMEGYVPDETALRMVVDAFADAPVSNPDGSDGITLHIMGDRDTPTGVSYCDPCVDDDLLPDDHWDSATEDFAALKAAWFGSTGERTAGTIALQAKAHAFRYCIFGMSWTAANGRTDYVGTAEYLGNDMAVTLGNFVSPMQAIMAGSLMHQLGHTFGLHHGGSQHDPSSEGRFNYKPNYPSVMNYLWQYPNRTLLSGVAALPLATYRASWRLDYSRGELLPLDESSLIENLGISYGEGITPSFLRYVPISAQHHDTDPAITRMDIPVDFDRNGYIGDTIASNLNNILGVTPPGTPILYDVLLDNNDWEALDYLPLSSPNWDGTTGASIMSSSSSAGEFESLGQRPEMSYAQFEQLGLLRFDCNANGIFDDIEIEQGAPDADGNGVPDACEGGQPSSVSNPAIADRPLRALGNPVVSLSRFVFSLAWPGRATVTIHDVTGRLIRVLLDGSLEAGDHEVSWTGTDDGSRPVVPGVYFVRLQAKGRDERAKIVMIR